ncbi:basic proline-rich protein-like [Physeter macrocephalus]|uniref:Basic proline-rich protein-like n=1 Tax=Physeter macrocephalus TaxID=9755 RepID=A0A9W2WT47_PHYMC|nr:basic proline-rich protein-like [Physeter catodon]
MGYCEDKEAATPVSSPRKLRVPQGLGCGPAGPGDGVGAALTPTRGAPGPGEEPPARRPPTHESPHGVRATEHRDPATSEPPTRRDPLHLRAPDSCDPRHFAVPDSPEPLSSHLGASDRPAPPPPLGPPGSSRLPCFSDPCSGAADARLLLGPPTPQAGDSLLPQGPPYLDYSPLSLGDPRLGMLPSGRLRGRSCIPRKERGVGGAAAAAGRAPPHEAAAPAGGPQTPRLRSGPQAAATNPCLRFG